MSRQVVLLGATSGGAQADMSSAESPTGRRLTLMGEFAMTFGTEVLCVPTNAERLLAFLAVRAAPGTRSTIATTLWIDSTEEQAATKLRATLWRTDKAAPGWVRRAGNMLSLASDVVVDLHRALDQAARLTSEPVDADLALGVADLERDLLPHWDEEWLLFERERVRQLRVHALESLCRHLTDCGRLAQAIDAGLAAVASEPLRESAHRTLIAAHLSEGNVSEARRQYANYRRLLHDQLGVEPSQRLRELVESSISADR